MRQPKENILLIPWVEGEDAGITTDMRERWTGGHRQLDREGEKVSEASLTTSSNLVTKEGSKEESTSVISVMVHSEITAIEEWEALYGILQAKYQN